MSKIYTKALQCLQTLFSFIYVGFYVCGYRGGQVSGLLGISEHSVYISPAGKCNSVSFSSQKMVLT